MDSIISAISEFFQWFMSTVLPQDTAETLLRICNLDWEEISTLLQEYIDVFFGGVA